MAPTDRENFSADEPEPQVAFIDLYFGTRLLPHTPEPAMFPGCVQVLQVESEHSHITGVLPSTTKHISDIGGELWTQPAMALNVSY